MRLLALTCFVAAFLVTATTLTADEPPALTEAEALGLIHLTGEQIAERLEARVNAGLPEETDLDEAIAAFEAFVVAALARVEAEHGAIWTQFDFDIEPSLWGTAEAAAVEGWTKEEYERAVAERRAAVAATVAALTTPEALRLIDRMAASNADRAALDPGDPPAWTRTSECPGRFAGGSVHLDSLLSRAARDAAVGGDDDAAVEHLTRLRALTGAMLGRPRGLIDGLMFASWISTLTEQGVRPVLASGALEATACRELRQVLEGIDCLAIGRAASDAEMFVAAGMLQRFLTAKAVTDQAVQTDWRLLVEQWASLKPAYETPIGQGAHWDKAAAFSDELDEKAGMFANLVAPARMRVAFNVQIAQLQVEADILMLALEEYRLDNGTHPETLDDLVPQYLDAVPIDPLTGQSFRYVREVEGEASPTTGYTLYSIGSDMHDDGGVVDPDYPMAGLSYRIEQSEPYDYIFNRPYPLPADPGAE